MSEIEALNTSCLEVDRKFSEIDANISSSIISFGQKEKNLRRIARNHGSNFSTMIKREAKLTQYAQDLLVKNNMIREKQKDLVITVKKRISEIEQQTVMEQQRYDNLWEKYNTIAKSIHKIQLDNNSILHQIEVKKSEMIHYDKKMKSKDEEIEITQTGIRARVTNFKNKIISIQNELEILQKKIDKKALSIRDYNAQLESVKKQHHNIIMEKIDSQQRIDEMNQYLFKNIQELKSDIQDQYLQYHKHENEKVLLLSQISNQKLKNTKLHAKVKKISKRVKEATENKSDSTVEYTSSDTKIGLIKDQIAELRKKQQEVFQAIEEKLEDGRSKIKLIRSYTFEIHEIKANKAVIVDQILNAKEEIPEECKIQEYQQEINELCDIYEEMQEKAELGNELDEKYENLKQKPIDPISQDYFNEIKQRIDETNQDLKNKVQKNKDKISKLSTKADEAEILKFQHEKDIRQIDQQIKDSDLIKVFNDSPLDKNRAKAVIEGNNKKREKIMKQKSKSIKMLENHVEELKARINIIKKKMNEQRETIRENNQRIENISSIMCKEKEQASQFLVAFGVSVKDELTIWNQSNSLEITTLLKHWETQLIGMFEAIDDIYLK